MVSLAFRIPNYVSEPLHPGLEAIHERIRLAFADAHVRAVEEEARAKAPSRCGALRNSIRAYLTGADTGALEAAAPHAKYLHEGTGVYGPRRRGYSVEARIRKALMWRGAGHPVRKTRHRGLKPHDFMRIAVNQHFSTLWAEAARANAELRAQVEAAYARMNESLRRELEARDAGRNRAWTEYARAAGYYSEDATPNAQEAGIENVPVSGNDTTRHIDPLATDWGKVGEGIALQLFGWAKFYSGIFVAGLGIAETAHGYPLGIHAVIPGGTISSAGGLLIYEGGVLIYEGFAGPPGD